LIVTKIDHIVALCLQNVTVQLQSSTDIRFAMTTFPGFSASTMLNGTDTAATVAAVTSEVGDMTDWTTQVVNVTSSLMTGGNEWPWSTSSRTAAETVEFDVTTASVFPTLTNRSEVDEADSGDTVDVAYQRLTNLAVIVAVYSVVLISMIVLACRRRLTGFEYRPADGWTDLELCSGDNDDDDGVDDSAAFKRYWDTRRDLAERQRLLDALRVDNISSVATGHLIDRLPEEVV